MRLSQYFLPTLKEIPAEAQIPSHRLMLRAGMMHQTTSGIYSYLPLGVRVIQKVEKIIREEMDKAGCHQIVMPTIQPASLWQESGRYDDYGKEMLRIKDRHDRDMLYGPTHEEVVTDIARQFLNSYKQLPQVLYQIHWKFRDEIRPRFGVMRGREFLMKDGYSFDLDYDSAKETYIKIYNAYLKLFKRIGVKAIPVQADSGPIGGNLSHEFQIVAKTGESAIFYDKKFEELDDLTFDNTHDLYAVTDEKYDENNCPLDKDQMGTDRGIEIGHIFYFGKKYSESMNLKVAGPNGEMIHPEMGSYGIGVTRIVAAAIEASHDDKGIIWPESIAPFKVGLINMKADDEQTSNLSNKLYDALQQKGVEVLLDDRKARAGVKFSDMDLIGLPYQVVVGNKAVKEGIFELKNRKTGEIQNLSEDALLNFFAAQ